jgi:hypothetical protein
MNEELTTFIITELGKHRDRANIVRRVCERGGLDWRDAERLIILIEARHKGRIVVRKSPWLLFLSIGALLLGIGLLAFNLQLVLAFFQKDVAAQILSLQSNAYRMMGLITGLCMGIGGLVGLWKAFGDIFPE